jgi:hypothetical protein
MATNEADVKMEYDPKNMPFRRLGPSGLRVPVFSLGGCAYSVLYALTSIVFTIYIGLTYGKTVNGDPCKVSEYTSS